MTALEKFLEQIILKKVGGSVYLVPAICDFQIEEALKNEKEQGETLPIDGVDSRRELLIADLKKMSRHDFETIELGFVDMVADNILGNL